jgi:hypothetical protein
MRVSDDELEDIPVVRCKIADSDRGSGDDLVERPCVLTGTLRDLRGMPLALSTDHHGGPHTTLITWADLVSRLFVRYGTG